jgi:cysteine desulfurase
MKQIYMDYSATTPMKPEVLSAMQEALKETYGNPSSVYSLGQEAKEKIEEARGYLASLIGAKPREIFFTSSGTEADNWAVHIAKKTKPGKHMITCAIEHHAVLHTMEAAQKEGYEVTFLPVDRYGFIDLEELEREIRDDTILISIMYVNNEIGTIMPIEEIGAIAKRKGILFHTDGVQALGNVPLDMSSSTVDMMSMSAHKIYGPKGIGALYIRQGTRVVPLLHGGAQERRMRASTENVPGIIAFGEAARLAEAQLEDHVERLTKLRDKLKDGLMQIPDSFFNGHPTKRHPGNVNICFKYIEGESMLLLLDAIGVCASSGSACTSGSLDPSHVLMGIGLPHEIAHGSLRLTLGDFTVEEDVDYVIKHLPGIIERLREMSPLTPQK